MCMNSMDLVALKLEAWFKMKKKKIKYLIIHKKKSSSKNKIHVYHNTLV